MPTHKKILQYFTDEGRVASASQSVTADGDLAFDGTVVHNATPANSEIEVDLAFPQANIKSILLTCSGAAVTIRSNANHSGSPGDTIALLAGGSLIWNTNDTGDNPFASADVTKLYITNESATIDAGVRIRVLLDVTP